MQRGIILKRTRWTVIVLVFSLLLSTVVPAFAEPWPEQSPDQWKQQQQQWQQPQNNNNVSAPQQQQWTPPASGKTIVTVSNQVTMPAAKRAGINLGAYDQYGAAQYLRNLIPNPGFEAGEMAMMFLAAPGSTANRVQPNRWDGFWNAHPSGFWDGAFYEVISGPARGQVGRVSRYALEGGKYTFYLEGNWTPFQEKDVIIVRKEIPGYHTETPTRFHTPELTERRPGSPGKQSLRIQPSGWEPGFAVPMDSFARDADHSAGKMNIVEGIWHFELWVKPTAPNQQVEIKFLRHREGEPFFKDTYTLHQGWQKIERKFEVKPGVDRLIPYDVNPLGFEVRVATNDADILIDDVELTRIDTRYDLAFSDRLVELLRELKPGVIRNWGHQFGSTLDNQLAEPWARKTADFDPNPINRNKYPVKFHYSLHEFLELSRVINAEPWYVVPPTWTAGELQNLIAYLSAPAGSHPYANKRAEMGQVQPWTTVFGQIHLEFGNEMWGGNTSGDPFAGATFWDGYHLGEVGSQRLNIMRASPYFQQGKIKLVMGGQAGFPERQMEIQSKSYSHDAIGVAPYFASHINAYGNQTQFLQSLLARPVQQTSDHGKMSRSLGYLRENNRNTELAVYEISSHLTHGNMPIYERNRFLTSYAMGFLLSNHMMHYQADLGVRTQAAFTALQYSWELPGRGERARLWGLLRDSESTGRKRPTWLGMEVINRGIRGDVITTEQSGDNPTWLQQPLNEITQPIEVPYIQSFAFRSWNRGHSVVLYNLDLYGSRNVELRLPFAPGKAANVHTLSANNMWDNNEDRENVKITTRQEYLGQNSNLTLPKFSITVIEWDG